MSEAARAHRVKLGEVEGVPSARGGVFAHTRAAVAQKVGLGHLGAQLMRVPPGNKAWPFHAHLANDEMYVILEGNGEMRLGPERFAVEAGDLIGCPAGGAETAHQLLNTGAVDLVYLCLSSMHQPEVMVYPDSAKTVTLVGRAALGPGETGFRHASRLGETVDYWEGEA
ncbi:MAG: cupin domain-containing protein [Pseudomonadota bacterium]